MGYTLWLTNIAMENGHRNSGFTHEFMVIFHIYSGFTHEFMVIFQFVMLVRLPGRVVFETNHARI